MQQDIQLVRVSQEVAERFYNLPGLDKGGRCRLRVIRVEGSETLPVVYVRRSPKADINSACRTDGAPHTHLQHRGERPY